MAEPLRLNATAGDTLVAQVYTGCSYHYEFARVIKVTPTGRIRVVPLATESVGERQTGEHCSSQPVRPGNALENAKTFVLKPNGDKPHSSWRCIKNFRIYTPNEPLVNFMDFGD